WGGLIDLDPNKSPDESDDAAAGAVLEALFRSEGEDQLAVRGAQYYVPRLQREPAVALPPPFRFSEDATFLITGGVGGLGRKLAVWTAEHGARHLCLTSRNAAASDADGFVSDLRSRGVEVLTINADVAREEDCRRVVSTIEQTLPRLGGVF